MTCTAMRAGRIKRFAELERKILRVLGERRHLQNRDRRARARRNPRGGLQRRFVEIVQDQHAFAGVGRKNISLISAASPAASTGSSHPPLGFGRGFGGAAGGAQE